MKLIQLFKNINMQIQTYKWNKQYINEFETKDIKFIWGIKSCDDMSDCAANFFTMNDFDILYFKHIKKYTMGVETVYMFENGKESEKAYLQNILDAFTKWMINSGYNTDKQNSLYDIFTAGLNINSQFDSIEDLYATFKFLVNGF